MSAELDLGQFTILIGANASGKSNIREAFRFLHGLSRGYSLAEIIGQKWGDGGFLQWSGLRGGTKEIIFSGEDYFGIFSAYISPQKKNPRLFFHFITVGSSTPGHTPVVQIEELRTSRIFSGNLVDNRETGKPVFSTDPESSDPVSKQGIRDHISVRLRKAPSAKAKYGQRLDLIDSKPVISQIRERDDVKYKLNRDDVRSALDAFSDMRFLDLNPVSMRMPSIPGQTVLGDGGENLSSVLHAICEEKEKKEILLEWVRELTPMDAIDFHFQEDASGRILVQLEGRSGHLVSANSASDGTLRFLAIIAALLGPNAADFYFFEEIDNGIHPTRLHLLLKLIEQHVKSENIQIVATTHSPDLLALVSKETLNDTPIVYRVPETNEGRIMELTNIPSFNELIEKQDLRRIYASGWFEDALYFLEGEGQK